MEKLSLEGMCFVISRYKYMYLHLCVHCTQLVLSLPVVLSSQVADIKSFTVVFCLFTVVMLFLKPESMLILGLLQGEQDYVMHNAEA